jgi:hypothetical protein
MDFKNLNMATNKELTSKLALDLGIDIKNRRPSAKETFKWLDIDLLPHSSADTLLCEIYEWNTRNWRTTGENLIGEIFDVSELPELKKMLIEVPKEVANVPDFEFTKEDIIDIGVELPSLFGIGFKGEVSKAKELSVKVNGVTKSRITNIDAPGIQIMHRLSEFAQKHTKDYRRKIKRNYIVKALFYAESVEIYLKKDADVDIEVGFALENVEVKAQFDTDTKKQIKLKYTGKMAPFAATFVMGKDFDF